MDDIWPLCDELPENPEGQAQRQQQGGGLVEGQAEAKHTDHLHHMHDSPP